ncbi:MAG: 2-oxoacid:acceptor oxidoreductase subunit alpha [Chloroflexi bacterium]|nr:2-oxoacid:acceptor oxidoreductase subunit alpha [Chloroflexota bacterium]MBM4451450.1 2-oxoacid:acceptor oxidoreductase subunit alpha [Chloroflexota bacterium]MBM4453189.1 2-oxoacid:acceptor oxidoreductase subunit alpha [Chloroflexota bacterium]
MTDNQALVGEFFINGDVACAEGAISAGCRFFAGYPITPATEVAERMSLRLPQVDGTYIQMEDEIASICAVLGASWAGVKAMTSTSGPGFSLMTENIGLGVMLETPCVVVDIQRAGPSTGLPTLVGQQDMMQARWGSHGSYEIIALSPSSPQHMFDLTIEAFNLSEKYRVPVLIMSDEVVGHMSEKVVIPYVDPDSLVERRRPSVSPNEYLPYQASDNLVPPMAIAGEGYHFHVTGLTHDERGYPVMTADAQDKLIRRLVDKIRLNKNDIIKYREFQLEDADIVVCAYGITTRIAQFAVELARNDGIRAGLLQLITIWPFAEDRIKELSQQAKSFIVPEINAGQIVFEVERCAADRAKTVLVPCMGGSVHSPENILTAIREAVC